MRLKNKKILVTAAGQGIGAASVLRMLQEGAHVLATDINPTALSQLALKVEDLGLQQNLETRPLDVTNLAEIKRLEQESAFNAVFNCAGYVHHGTILDCDEEAWRFSWEINITSMYRIIHTVLPKMLLNGGGSIINVSSAASSIKGVPNRFVYGTTKAAVIGLTKSIAADFVTQGIRCNAICPGTIDSPSLQQRIQEQAKQQNVDIEQIRAGFIARQPMGRLGKDEELSALVAYLASDESAFTTGTTHIIDGGWSN